MISATIHPVPNSATPTRGEKWEAICLYNGEEIRVSSRSGVSCDLCRELVSRGAKKEKVRFMNDGGKVLFEIDNIKKMAKKTYSENDRTRLTLINWQPYEGN